MTTEVTLPEALEATSNALMVDFHVSFPAKVTSYDSSTQTATVEPMIRKPVLSTDLNDEEDSEENLPSIPNVPILHPRGGNTSIHIPIKAGDFVMVVVTDFDMSGWRSTGRKSSPITRVMHSIASCYGIAGASHDGNRLSGTAVSSDDITITNGSFTATFKSDKVEFGGASDAAALASAVAQFETSFNNLVTAFNTHKHTGVQTGGGSSGLTDTPGSTSGQSFASSRIKTDS